MVARPKTRGTPTGGTQEGPLAGLRRLGVERGFWFVLVTGARVGVGAHVEVAAGVDNLVSPVGCTILYLAHGLHGFMLRYEELLGERI